MAANRGARWQARQRSAAIGFDPFFPFLIDPLNPNRILVGGPGARGVFGWSDSAGSLSEESGVTSLAVAGYQGVFQEDPAASLMSRIPGSMADDPNTIYVANGSGLLVTTTWG